MTTEIIINAVLLGVPAAFTVFFAAMLITHECRKED